MPATRTTSPATAASSPRCGRIHSRHSRRIAGRVSPEIGASVRDIPTALSRGRRDLNRRPTPKRPAQSRPSQTESASPACLGAEPAQPRHRPLDVRHRGRILGLGRHRLAAERLREACDDVVDPSVGAGLTGALGSAREVPARQRARRRILVRRDLRGRGARLFGAREPAQRVDDGAVVRRPPRRRAVPKSSASARSDPRACRGAPRGRRSRAPPRLPPAGRRARSRAGRSAASAVVSGPNQGGERKVAAASRSSNSTETRSSAPGCVMRSTSASRPPPIAMRVRS